MKNTDANTARLAEIKELLTYYQDITETIREPFIILDKNLIVVTANAAFYLKFKVSKKLTEGKRIYDLGSGQWDAPELRELLEDILPKNKVLNNYIVTHDFPNIGTKIMLLNARQVDAKQLIMLAMIDVTAQNKLDNDASEMTANLIRQRDELQRLNSAKDEFISLASHQLRTPATAVKQYLGMLTQGFMGAVTQEQMKMLEAAYSSNERQLEIIDDLLRVAKVDAGKIYLEKTSNDMVKIVEDVIQHQAIVLDNKEQRVIFIKPLHSITATIDQKLISMVIENLLDNASKYSPKGSQINIYVEQTDKWTSVSVQDNGVGIHENDKHKLYKRFSRIHNPLSISVGGTGLGLYWAKKILDLHEGEINVVSKINAGSTFTIRLPMTHQLAQELDIPV